MKLLGGTLRAYVELARASNLPTCVSNSLVGCALGAGDRPFPWEQVPPVAAAIGLLYVAGMALNDIADRGSDSFERPERPIPSGRISLWEAWGFVGMMLLLGLGLLSNTSRAAMDFGLLLLACIALYDLLHKRYSGSVLLMGACRLMVYVVAGAAIAWPFDLFRGYWLAGTLGVYTVAITIVARSENAQVLDRRRWLALALPAAILAAAFIVRPQHLPAPALAAVLLLLWLARAARAVFAVPPNTRAAIHLWISGMCLIDTFFLALLDRPLAALLALGCFGITAYSHRHIPGT